MHRVLKSRSVTVDNDNRVTIEVAGVFESMFTDSGEEQTEQGAMDPPRNKDADDILLKARREAERIMENSRADAEMILRNAQENAEALAAQSAEAGYKDGYDTGYKEGENKAKALQRKAQNTLDEAKSTREAMILSVEKDMVDIVVAIANKLLMDAAAINPHVIMALIKKGISESSTTGDVVIRVSESEYDAVLENKARIAKLVEASSRLEIVKDASLSLGDCVIETPYGDIDCGLDGQLKALTEYIYYLYNPGGAVASANE